MGRFDPGGNAWVLRAPLPGPAIPGTCLAARSDGRLVGIPGGVAGTQIYDPATDLWSPGASIPSPANPGSILVAHADGRLFFHPGGTTDVFEAPATGANWTELPLDPPGLPSTNPLAAAPSQFFVMTGSTFASLPVPAAVDDCDCDHGSDFGGCAAGGNPAALMPLAAGLLVLLYARRRSASS